MIDVLVTGTTEETEPDFVREAMRAGVSKKEIQAAALMAWGTGVTVAELAIPLIQEVEKSLNPTRFV